MKHCQTLRHTGRHLMTTCLLMLLRVYQLLISPMLGPRCRFFPSCSEYCKQALIEHGPVRGLYLGGRRLCRCHPGHPGGFDPVPRKSQHDG